jgi:RpiB/LacA/LacB family sugar-phosphate isomerase
MGAGEQAACRGSGGRTRRRAIAEGGTSVRVAGRGRPRPAYAPRMRIGLAADHGGFELKEALATELREEGHQVVDFGPRVLDPDDDYPDTVIPLARAVAASEVERGIAVCGSGIGASVAASKVGGVRAAVCHDVYSAHQGVEHDDLNVLCLGARVVGPALARELVRAFLGARYTEEDRHARRLAKLRRLEDGWQR